MTKASPNLTKQAEYWFFKSTNLPAYKLVNRKNQINVTTKSVKGLLKVFLLVIIHPNMVLNNSTTMRDYFSGHFHVILGLFVIFNNFILIFKGTDLIDCIIMC